MRTTPATPPRPRATQSARTASSGVAPISSARQGARSGPASATSTATDAKQSLRGTRATRDVFGICRFGNGQPMSMFSYGDAPRDVETADSELCWCCESAVISELDVFGNHCAACILRMRREIEGDFGPGGSAQLLLARHRAFDDWLRHHRR